MERIGPSRNEARITRSRERSCATDHRVLKFMLIVTEPPNVSTREVIKISREFTEVTALSYGARAPVELVPRQGWLKHMKSNSTKPPPPVLPTLRRVNKTLIVESDESGKEVDAQNVHDEVTSSSSGNQVDVVDKNGTSNQCDETSELTSDVNPEGKNEEVPQECDSTADVKQMT